MEAVPEIIERERPAGLRRLESAFLWLFAFSGFFVLVEPSPYELVFLATAVVFAITGLTLHPSHGPLIVLLVTYNLGGLMSLLPVLGDSKALTFTAVTIYLSVTTLFFAAVLMEDTRHRFRTLRNGYVAAGLAAALAGIAGYFDIAGLGGLFTLYGRAAGTFKDPNVFSAFLVPPIIFLAQDLLLGKGRTLIRTVQILILLFALFLAFSRGAWFNGALSLVLLGLLTFFTTPDTRLRARIVLAATAGVAMIAAGLLVALSIEPVRQLFELRASLTQSYDVGETGRFANMLRSLPLLVDSPNGIGPLQFSKSFGADPHNVYINAFASYGWLGGFSYLALIVLTLIAGLRTVLTDSPYRRQAIAIFAPTAVTIFQGLQIDTDHWRHLYLLLGAIWGLHAVTVPYRQAPGRGAQGAPVRP